MTSNIDCYRVGAALKVSLVTRCSVPAVTHVSLMHSRISPVGLPFELPNIQRGLHEVLWCHRFLLATSMSEKLG